MTVITKDIENHWIKISPLLTIQNEEQYEMAVERLNTLLDHIGTNESHPLYELMDTLGTVIHSYEEQHHSIHNNAGFEILQHLMEEHDLTSSDLPEIGSSDTVSAILNNKKELSLDQIRYLSTRFSVSPSVFI